MSINLWVLGAALGGVVWPVVEGVEPPKMHSRQTSNAGTISWSVCPDLNTSQCGFLDVPMDYSNPNSGSTVSMFLRKYPATSPADQRLGSVLVSPGGPGGSGSAAVVALRNYINKIVDGRYDIIGFDQRAVNLTGPPTACHDVEYKFGQKAYQLDMQGVPFPHVGGAGEIAHVAKLAAIQSSHHIACVQNGNQEMLRNSGTVAVAKDMERIVEALGEDGLNFIGYSYGTILGATFAAIRPNLVKRMVLDGVSDAEAYFSDVLEWGRSAMQETNKTLEGFISTCVDAGPSWCALAATKDNKTETVQGLTKRLDALYTRLGKDPLAFGDSPIGPGIVQASNVQSIIFACMYEPYTWPLLAQTLVAFEQGDTRDAHRIINNQIYGAVPEPYTQNVFKRSMQRLSANTRESQYPILCGDSPRLNITIEEYAKYFRKMGMINSVAEQFALVVGGCRGWPFRAEGYSGPWTVEKGLKKTRFPILFVNLDADPVTPLASAVKMSRGFGSESATLLVQRGFGHPSLAHPSLCTMKHIRDYFVNATIPKNGTYCTPEPGWIFPRNDTLLKRSHLSKRDRELLETTEKLARATKLAPGPIRLW